MSPRRSQSVRALQPRRKHILRCKTLRGSSSLRTKMSIEITLIQEIEKHPCLYNFYLHEYNRKDILDDTWTAVSTNCDLTVPECKDKWKNIRSSFVRSLKQNIGKMKKPYYLSNYLQFIVPFIKSGAEFITDDNPFIDADSNDNADTELPVLATIKIEPDIEVDADQIDFGTTANTEAAQKVRSDLSSHPRSTFLRKKKRMAAASTKNHTTVKNVKIRRIDSQPVSNTRTENNAMRFFLMSLLPEFDTMNEDQVRMFKIKVMMLIDDIKTQCSKVREDTTFNYDCLQKQLINLLLKNLERT